jgi:Na+/H+-dicarboxylate symporter
MKQHQKLLLGFILGVVAGLIGFYFLPVKAFPLMKFVTEVFTLVGAVFLKLIFMVVVPLLVSALILGVFELGKGRGLGKVAGKSLMYTLVLSSLAVFIAITMTNVLQPGVGVTIDKAALASNQSVLSIQKNVQAVQGKTWYQYIVDLLPQNPLDSAVRAFSGEIIALMIFSLIFGYELSLVSKDEEKQYRIQAGRRIPAESCVLCGCCCTWAFNSTICRVCQLLENVRQSLSMGIFQGM